MTDPRPRRQAGKAGLTLVLVIAFTLGWGMFSESPRGAVLGALLGYLFAQVMILRGRVRELEQRSSLDSAVTAAAVAAAAARARPAQATTTPAAPPAAPRETVAPPVAAPPAPRERLPWEPEPALATSAGKAPAPATPSVVNQFVDKSIASFVSWLKGGNPLARVGIFVLFCGGAFLAKYASEAGFFPIEFRLMALAAGAAVLLGVGWWLRQHQRGYALTLQGGGVAILYLTVFVALKMYHLLGPGFALPLLIVIALSAAVLAVAQNAMSMAVIGFSGGFLAPILASTGGGNHIALFSYYAVLNLGLFAIAWFRAWRVLNLVGFVFTFGIAGTFRAAAYQPEDMVSTDFFVILFFLMYVGVSVLFALRQPPKLRGYVSSSLVFGLPVAAFALQASLLKQVEFGLAYSALGYGLFYLLLAWALYLSRHPNLKLLTEAFAALGVIFASLAVPAAFDEQTTSAMWAVEGAGLLWLGTRQNRKLARAFGAALQCLGGLDFLWGLQTLTVEHAVLNSAYIGTLMLAMAGLLSGLWLFRSSDERAKYEQGWDLAAALWGTAWWVYGGLHEMDRFLPQDYRIGAALAFAAITITALHVFGTNRNWPLPGRIAQALLAVAVVLGFAAAADHSHPFAQSGDAGWLLLFAAGYLLLSRQERTPDEGLAALTQFLHPFFLCAFALLVAWESNWRIAREIGGVWAELTPGVVAALLLWNLGRERPLPAWPLSRHADAYRLGAGPVLAVVGAMWIIGINLYSDGNPYWLPYYPLLNPLDLCVALLLGAMASWWMSLSAELRARLPVTDLRWNFGGFAALGFLWLSAALVRALHYTMGTPIHWDGIAHSFIVQAGLSIFWGLLGFCTMLLATRLGRRELWIAGAGLMAVVVVKLFVVDLEGSGTLARISSFITIGALLLVTGYFSPLPPKKTAEDASS